MPVADNAVDRPLVDVVVDAIDADDELSDGVKDYVLAALEGGRLRWATASWCRTSLRCPACGPPRSWTARFWQ